MVAGKHNWSCLLTRWTARIVSAVQVLMVVAIAVGEGVPRPASLTWTGICHFAAFLLILMGLLAAWRWERAGALAALLGLAVFQGIEFALSGRFAGGLFPWFAVPAVLYLLASWLERHPFDSRLRRC
jgi:hypothetical protein